MSRLSSCLNALVIAQCSDPRSSGTRSRNICSDAGRLYALGCSRLRISFSTASSVCRLASSLTIISAYCLRSCWGVSCVLICCSTNAKGGGTSSVDANDASSILLSSTSSLSNSSVICLVDIVRVM